MPVSTASVTTECNRSCNAPRRHAAFAVWIVANLVEVSHCWSESVDVHSAACVTVL